LLLFNNDIAISFVIPPNQTHVFVYQKKSNFPKNIKGFDSVNLKLSAAMQFTGFLTFIFSNPKFSKDQTIKIISDLVGDKKSLNATYGDICESYQILKENLENAPIEIILMIIGKLLGGQYELLKQSSSLLYDLFVKINEGSVEALQKIINLPEQSKLIAYNGFLMLNHVLMVKGDQQIIAYWDTKPTDRLIFNRLVVSYFDLIKSWRITLPENIFRSVERAINKVHDPDDSKKYLQRLLLYSYSLIGFLNRITKMYPTQSLSKNLDEEIYPILEEYIRTAPMTFTDILGFLEMLRESNEHTKKLESSESVIKLISNNITFKQSLKRFFEESHLLNFDEIPILLEIYRRDEQKKYLSLERAVVIKILSPIFMENSLQFAKTIDNAYKKLLIFNSDEIPNIDDILKKRISSRFSGFEDYEQIQTMYNDYTAISSNELTLKNYEIPQAYLAFSLQEMRHLTRNSKDRINLCQYLDKFNESEIQHICDEIFKWISEDILSDRNFKPYESIVQLLEKYRDSPNKGVNIIFEKLYKYFDDNKGKTYKSPAEFITRNCETIFLLMKYTDHKNIPNSIGAILKLFSELKTQEISYDDAKIIERDTQKVHEEIINCFKLIKIETPHTFIYKLMDDIKTLQKKINILKDFSEEKDLLEPQEKKDLSALISGFCKNCNTKSIVKLKADLNEKLSDLIHPLSVFYNLRKSACIRTLLLKFIGQNMKLSEFPKKLEDAVNRVKLFIHQFINSQQFVSYSNYYELFGNSTDINDEIKKLKEFIPEDSKLFDQLVEHNKSFAKIHKNLTFADNLIELKNRQIVDLGEDAFYRSLEKYKAEIMNMPTTEAIKETNRLRYNLLNNVFGIRKSLIHEKINQFSDAKELILLIRELKLDQLNAKKKIATESLDELIQVQTLDSMIELYKFLDYLQINCKTCTDKAEYFCDYFYRKNDNINDLLAHSKHYLKQLRELLAWSAADDIVSFKKAEQILKKSLFTITKQANPNNNTNRTEWSYIIHFTDEGKEYDAQLSYEQLLALRERVMHHKNLGKLESQIIKDAKLQKSDEFVDTFLNLTRLLKKIINIMNELSDLAHPDMHVNFKISLNNSDLTELEVHLKEMELKKVEWQNALNKVYNSYRVMTFFFPSQFEIIESYFDSSKNANIQLAKDLLRFAGIEGQKNSKDEYCKSEKDIEKRSVHFAKYMNSLCNMPEAKPLETNNIVAYCIKKTNLLESLFGLYYFFKDCEFPRANQILFCHNDSKPEEILGFIYRTIKNPDRIFCLVYPENLSSENQKLLVSLIREDIKRGNNRVPICIITDKLESSIIQDFEGNQMLHTIKNSIWQSFHANAELVERIHNKITSDKFLFENYNLVLIVRSNNAGQGKSTIIKNHADDNSLQLRYISLYGEVSILDVISKISNILPSMEYDNKIAICFKIMQISNEKILDELFLQILIFRCLQYGTKLVMIPQKMRIYVEIVSTVDDFIENNFPLVKYLPTGSVENQSIFDVKINIPICTRVFNYLRLLEDGKILDNAKELNVDKVSGKYDFNSLITKHISEKLSNYELSWIHMSVFCKFFSKMLQNYEKCPLFHTNFNKGSKISRTFIVNQLLQSSIILVENTLRNREAISKDQYSEVSGSGSMHSNCSSVFADYFKDSAGYKKYNKPMLTFTESGNLLPIYQNADQKPENTDLLLDYYSTFPDCENYKIHSDLLKKGYSKMNHSEFAEFLRIVFKIPDLKTDNYVLTLDNFYKLLYIYVRAISNIPVILMGETGCGKTWLIKFLCDKILKANLDTINIHKGITAEYIISFMQEVIGKATKNKEKRFCVFFDEFNTNDNIGLLTEIISDRMLNGQNIPENILFFAACNPYKKEDPKSIENNSSVLENSAGISKDKFIKSFNRKIYSVIKMPLTMMEYVWDFGQLDPDHEHEYIKAIISSDISEKSIQPIIIKIIQTAHDHFKRPEFSKSKEEQPQIISLRDIKRFIRLYNWFTNTEKKSEKNSAILAFIFCYYYRISNEISRKALLKSVSAKIFNNDTGEKLKEFIDKEAKYYTSQIKLDNGIVWNNSLRECLFVMIISVLTKSPLIVVGKPGCSKTLSLQILQEHFCGKNSSIDFFKKYPEIQCFSLQGSLHCNSNDVIKVFNKAENTLKANKENEILPVVVIEEIGLCELSLSNPLKVLHQKLEVENYQFGFIGLSNWRLDAAKMNRALYLNRVPPSEEEIILTADEIYQSVNKNEEEPLIKILAQAYWSNQELKRSSSLAERFGLRDFYAMMKQLALVLPKESDFDAKCKLIKQAIRRNFSNFSKHDESLWKTFCDIEPQASRTMIHTENRQTLIFRSMANSSVKESWPDRFVLVAGEYKYLSNLLQIYVNLDYKKMQTIVGSEFENDLNDPDYTNRVLSNIIYCAQNGKPVILKSLKEIHSHLYDLYNQRHGSDSCRIMAGEHFHPICKLHEDFRCLIIMDINDFYEEKPPFLNRLEKYYLKLDKLITETQKKWFDAIYDWVTSLVCPQDEHETTNLQKLFANFDSNNDFLRILIASQNTDFQISNVEKQVIRLATEDFLSQLHESRASNSLKRRIIEMYNQEHKNNFEQEISLICEKQSKLRKIIFTYIARVECIAKLKEKSLKDHNFRIIVVNSIKAEEELKNELQEFYVTSKNENTVIFAMDLYNEYHHLEHIISIIAQYENENIEKNICFLVFTKRNDNLAISNKPVIFINGYDMIMIDSIEISNMVKAKEIKEEINKLMLEEIQKLRPEILNFLLEKSFGKLRANWENYQEYTSKNPDKDFKTKLSKFCQNSEIMSVFIEKIKEITEYDTETDFSIRERLSGDSGFRFKGINNAAKQIISEKIQHAVYVILYTIEQYSSYESYFKFEGSDAIWLDAFKMLNFDPTISEFSKIFNPYYYGLIYPFSLVKYENLLKFAINADKEVVKGISMRQSLKENNYDPLYSEIIENLWKYDFIISQKLLHDFFMIQATKNRIKVNSVIVENFIKFIMLDKLCKSVIFGYSIKLLIERDKISKSLLGLLGMCSELPIDPYSIFPKSVPLELDNKAGQPISDSERIQRKIQDCSAKIIDTLIEILIPTPDLYKSLTDLKISYKMHLMKLYSFAFQVCDKELTKKVPNWNSFLFWLELAKLNLPHIMLSIAEKLNVEKTTKNLSTMSIMQSDEFVQFCLNLFDKHTDYLKQIPSSYKCKVSLYRILLANHNSKFIELIFSEFNEENMEFLYGILVTIVDFSKMLTIAKNLQTCDKDSSLIPDGILWRKIENYLVEHGVTCGLGNAIFYNVYQRISSINSFKMFLNSKQAVDSLDKFIKFTYPEKFKDKCECPKIRCLLSCVYIRKIMQIYLKSDISEKQIITNTEFSEIFEKLLKGNESPIVPTLQIFFKNLVTNYQAKLEPKLDKYIFPYAFYDEKHSEFEKFLKNTSYLKKANFVVEKEKMENWYKEITDIGKIKYYSLMNVGIVFIRELYSNYFDNDLTMKNSNNTLADKLEQDKDWKKILDQKLGEEFREFIISLNNNFADQCDALSAKLKSNSSEEQLKIILLFVICISLASRDIQNPFSCCFYSSENQPISTKISKSYLFGLTDKVRSQPTIGYYNHLVELGNKKDNVREISNITHRVLHFMLHTILYYHAYKNKLTEPSYSISKLQEHAINDAFIIHELLKIDESNDSLKNTFIWILKVLCDFSRVLPSLGINQDASKDEYRRKFEKDFEKYIIEPNLKNPKETVENFIVKIKNLTNENHIETALKFDEQCKFYQFFATKKSSSLIDFKKYLLNENVKEKFPIAQLIGTIDENKTEKIQHLLRIIKFTNLMLDEYSYKITRQKAEIEDIQILKMENIKEYKNNFYDAWTKCDFSLDSKDVDFEKYSESKLTFKESNNVIDFLLDPKLSTGKIMIAGIEKLSEYQNSIISIFHLHLKQLMGGSEFKENPFFDIENCQVQNISVHDLVSPIKINDISQYIYYYPDKNQKLRIYYDFPRIENGILVQLMDKPHISCENMRYMVYSDECSKTIELLRKLKQIKYTKQLLQVEIQNLMQFCEQLVKDRDFEKINEIMNTLKIIICYINETRQLQNENLKDFCVNNFGISSSITQFLSKQSIIPKIEICKILSLYETLEINFFDLLSSGIPKKFRGFGDEQQIKENLDMFKIKACKNVDILSDLLISIKKFILRFLDEEFNNENEPLKEHVFIEDLWAENYFSRLNEFKDQFSIKIKVKDALELVNIIIKDIEKSKRNLSSENSSVEVKVEIFNEELSKKLEEISKEKEEEDFENNEEHAY